VVRWLEVRRHSLTKKGESRGRGSDLSAEGVALARAIGAPPGSFARVGSSPLPRAIETAIAMGFAVDELIDLPSGYVPGEVAHHDQWGWPQPYVRYSEIITQGGGLAQMAAACRASFEQLVSSVPDGHAALLISHGGTIEPALVACLPDADHAAWGPCFSHCDGARLAWDNGAFSSIELRRAPSYTPDLSQRSG
jgi:broad specificity phosphatase PhoE